MSVLLNSETDLKEKLKEAQAGVSAARNEVSATRRTFDQARAAVAKLNVPPVQMSTTSEWKAAETAKGEADEAWEKLEKVKGAELGLLQMMGQSQRPGFGVHGPRSSDGPAGDGWAHVAREIDLPSGRNRVDVPLGDLLHAPAMAGLTITPSSGLTAPAIYGPFIEKAQDERHVWQAFPFQQLDQGILAVSDYRQTGARTVTGTVERDPVSTAAKATLNLAVTLETPPLKQLALLVENVPVKLLEIEGFGAFLRNELSYQLSKSLDLHTINQVLGAAPPSGLTGANLLEQARHGASAMRALGGVPRVLALNPEQAAELDTLKTGAEGLEQYVFGSKSSGSAAPLWNMAIVEVPGLEHPMLLDPPTLALLYSGAAMLLIDPYSGADTNTVRLRLEVEALLHIRDIAGAYVLAA